MGDKVKRLCKWKKDQYKKKFGELTEAVLPVRYICQNCGRAAAAKEFLCKPEMVKPD